MEINTRYFGPVQVNPAKIINFPEGIPGFEDHKKFLILDVPEKKYKCLQSLQSQYIAFIVVNPWDYYGDYEFGLSQAEFEKIEVEKTQQLAVFNILTLGDTLEDTTINLLAPIVINTEKKKGCQVVLNESSYSTKMPLFPKEPDSAGRKEAPDADTD